MIKELNYDLTKEDYKNYAKEQKEIKFLGTKKYFITNHYSIFLIIMLFPLSFFLWIAIISHSTLFYVISILIALLSIVMCFVDYMYLFPIREARKKIKIREQYGNTNTHITINSEDGTLIVADLTKEIYYLNHCYSVENKKNNILVFTTKYQAIIIPKRIFESEQEMNETWELIQECYNKNREDIR